MTENTLTIRRPDDWHVHFRDGEMLKAVAPHTAVQFGRAIVMPNLVPPVTTVDAAAAYRDRIKAALPDHPDFQPLMTCYLTDQADAAEIAKGYEEGVFSAVKFYPAGATTNSDSGVTDIKNVSSVFAKMQEIGMPLLVHGEVTDPTTDIFDREALYIERILKPIMNDFPKLKIVMEHITTKDAVDFVRSQADSGRLAATITPHHLVINRTDIFKGGINPHLYCLPIAKREVHRLALRDAATSGEAQFFLGTDTAPHARHAKESACGCAGIFSALTALEIYTQVFDEEGALDKLEAFASLNGPNFYGLPVAEETVTLERKTWSPEENITTESGDPVRIFGGGEEINWKLV
ncbi:dihydroorotase [Terasakiella sp. A23]|uniref:dihydroorotase n=1 Tax=Terasakiella sp. FCG-A23 TaxID=3080561 RepID=UPI0029542486|nr:dihydroorotase [Terasakiella sp. A23]MDV7339271.1 dihydroorotase [Terasakiella sp. A23]